jgi:hypothetical protein
MDPSIHSDVFARYERRVLEIEHRVDDGASNLFVQLFGAQAGHVRVVYGVHSAPIGAPVMVETVFEIESPQLEAQEETHE